MATTVTTETTLPGYLTKVVRDIAVRADALDEADDLPGAIDEISKAVEIDPHSPVLRSRRGMLYYFSEEWQLAIQDFDLAIEAQPDFVLTMFFRGRAKSELGDLDGALRDFEEVVRRQFAEAVRKKEQVADAYYEIGTIHQRRGELQRALTAYESADRAVEGGFLDVSEEIAEIREKLDSQK